MGAEILIVDDDPMVGELTKDLLVDAGYGVALVQDSALVLDALREHRPRLVLLDILMPGTDGLTLLHAIKQDPGFSGIKVAVVSAKSFKAEIDRAKNYGADDFIRKPYDVEAFPGKVSALIGPPVAGGAAPAPAKVEVRARVWGSPAAGSTPCMSVEAMDRLFILDAGEGVVALGEEILRANRCREAWLLLSHYHPDHVAGLGRLPLLRQEGFTLRILGPADPDESLPKRLRDALEKSFAADRRPIAAKITIHELKEDAYDLAPGVKLNAFFLNHPSTTLGYLLHLGGKRLAYCPDAELYGDQATALQDYDERTARACRGVDLLVHDARWLGKDRAAHKDEGHSDAPSTGAFAAECEAARLWLFHADPGYSAEELSALEAEAKAALEEKGFHIPCQVAKDGLEVSF